MMSAILGIAIFIVVIVMSTLGSVLLAQFVIGKSSRAVRVAAATILGPGMMLIPFSIMALFDGDAGGLAAFFGIGVIGMVMCGIVSWPTAYFATKKLDRLTYFDVETFE